MARSTADRLTVTTAIGVVGSHSSREVSAAHRLEPIRLPRCSPRKLAASFGSSRRARDGDRASTPLQRASRRRARRTRRKSLAADVDAEGNQENDDADDSDDVRRHCDETRNIAGVAESSPTVVRAAGTATITASRTESVVC